MQITRDDVIVNIDLYYNRATYSFPTDMRLSLEHKDTIKKRTNCAIVIPDLVAKENEITFNEIKKCKFSQQLSNRYSLCLKCVLSNTCCFYRLSHVFSYF